MESTQLSQPDSPSQSVSDRFTLSFPKKFLIPLLLLLVFFGLVLLEWQTNFLQAKIKAYNQAKVEIVVTDNKTSKPLQGVEVKIADLTQKTNETGRASFDALTKGEHSLSLELPGYQPKEVSLRLASGLNDPRTYQLEALSPVKVQLAGVVRDYVDQGPIQEGKIELAGITSQTREDGSFVLKEVQTGQYDLKISHANYLSLIKSIDIGAKDVAVGPYFLVPQGRVVFVSNRDGYRAVYTANLDGSRQAKLWQNEPKKNDSSPVLSLDSGKIFFYSDREGAQDDYGGVINKLYLYDITNKKVAKLSDDSYYYDIQWLPDSSAIIYQTSKYTGHSEGFIKKIDAKTYQTVLLVSNRNFVHDAVFSSYLSAFTVSQNGKMFAVYVSIYDFYQDKSGLYLGFTDGSDFKRISERETASNLKFLDNDRRITYDTYEASKKRSFSINLSNLEETEITNPNVLSAIGYPGYFVPQEVDSPDGKLVAFTDHRDGKTDLYLKNADDTLERRLTTLGGVSQIYFTPNSRDLVFSVQKESESAAYVVGLKQGNEPLKITDISEGDSLAGVIE